MGGHPAAPWRTALPAGVLLLSYGSCFRHVSAAILPLNFITSACLHRGVLLFLQARLCGSCVQRLPQQRLLLLLCG